MSKKIYFDMDGTLYNLYGIPDWLTKIETEKSGVFLEGKTLFNPAEFYKAISKLYALGFDFGIITWLPMGASLEYEEVCRAEKLEWLENHLPFISEINIVSYGIPKQKVIQKRATDLYLIDDNKEVCEEWEFQSNRKAIQLTKEFQVIDALRKILNLYK